VRVTCDIFGRPRSLLHADQYPDKRRRAPGERALPLASRMEESADRFGLRELVVKRNSMVRRQDMHRDLAFLQKVQRLAAREGTRPFEEFSVEHSILSPAVGYRVSAGRACIFYAPDLIFIHKRSVALQGVEIYVGDGATVTQSFIRRRGKALIGHSPVRAQLTWCQKEGVPRAIITHCGSEIVTGDERDIAAKVFEMATERGIEVRIAYDGMKVRV